MQQVPHFHGQAGARRSSGTPEHKGVMQALTSVFLRCPASVSRPANGILMLWLPRPSPCSA
jgi:hypothetical protein